VSLYKYFEKEIKIDNNINVICEKNFAYIHLKLIFISNFLYTYCKCDKIIENFCLIIYYKQMLH